jgi:hypothetical protein
LTTSNGGVERGDEIETARDSVVRDALAADSAVGVVGVIRLADRVEGVVRGVEEVGICLLGILV